MNVDRPSREAPRPPSLPDAGLRTELRRTLLGYYDRSARSLPWRGESDPYRILVSEVMLQQTRVETVKRYYERWLERFPDLATLAEAGEDDVLKAWEGLGYYRRARNLHRAAKVVHRSAGGTFPSDASALRELPGIGAYTAGAVASIAFGQPAAAVDGNVRRVLARLFDVAEPSAKWLRTTAQSLVDPERPGDWNQALMELGATVCGPQEPACDACPLARWCAARAAGTQSRRPAAAARRAVPTRHFALGIFHAEGRALLVRRPGDGLLGGLWAFPEARLDSSATPKGVARAVREIAAELGLTLRGAARSLPACEHRFTHLHAVYHPAVFTVDRGALDPTEAAWVDPNDTGDVALPVAQRRLLEGWAASVRVRREPAMPDRSGEPAGAGTR